MAGQDVKGRYDLHIETSRNRIVSSQRYVLVLLGLFESCRFGLGGEFQGLF